MILMLHVHYSRAGDIVIPDQMRADPSVPVTAHRDPFGNWCGIVAPAGRLDPSATAVVNDPGLTDRQILSAQQHEVRIFQRRVWYSFSVAGIAKPTCSAMPRGICLGQAPMGWGRVQTICDYVHNHITFGYEHARRTKTAWEALNDAPECAVIFLFTWRSFLPVHEYPRVLLHRLSRRHLGYPGRPNGFRGFVRGLYRGRRHTFDPRNNVPRIGRVLIARERDAADVAIATTFGPNTLESFTVLTDQVG